MWLKRKDRQSSLVHTDEHNHSHEGCTACPEHGGPKSASRRRFMAGAVAGGAALIATKFLPPLTTPVLAVPQPMCTGACCPCLIYQGTTCVCYTSGCGGFCPFGCSPDKLYVFDKRCKQVGTPEPCDCGPYCFTFVRYYCNSCSGCRTL